MGNAYRPWLDRQLSLRLETQKPIEKPKNTGHRMRQLCTAGGLNMAQMADETGLGKTPANYVPLTPLSHLKRARDVFATRTAMVYHDRRHSYAQLHDRCTRLGAALAAKGIKPGDVVSTLCPNIPAIAEAHFGVPLCGAVLNTINTRLDPDTIAYIFAHSESKIVLADSQFLPVALQAIALMDSKAPEIIEVADPLAGFPATGDFTEYEDFIAAGDPAFDWHLPDDEWDAISLNYTSGTTGRPKGVVCHHRGAYLMTMGTALSWEIGLYPKYLTIVPLFHCNGWNHTWMMPSLGGQITFCRDMTAKAIFGAIAAERITHFGGAPIILNTLINAKPEDRAAFDHTVNVLTAGAPPSPATIKGAETLGFKIMQVYGLTETYGHVTECVEPDDWAALPAEERYAKMARVGVQYPMMEDIDVVDQDSRKPVPRDGKTIGEIVIRGNAVMKGYYKNPTATAEAFAGGAFRSGDIAVRHPDGYIQITDRMKDIIISGGENISSVEVENTLMSHPAVSLCAVVARPDEQWGETPCAFIELKDGVDQPTPEEIIAHTRAHLSGFKCPKTVLFQELPKTSTGKIQKFELRVVAKAL
ncbi:fatty-acyl-CoA synthase [Roseobacter sp. N2S]|nr:fatty-acyl-CoA synthase [Roseobacter sp. N2S]